MPSESVLTIRCEELRRRVAGLPVEVEKWQKRTHEELDMQVHSSQIQAIDQLMHIYADRQIELINRLEREQDVIQFQELALELIRETILAQRVWDFFRDKLDLRFSPHFQDPLWIADTVAWNCYTPVIERAIDAGILPSGHFREPPLTYLTAEYSPATWVRGSRPNDGRNYSLGTSILPIPVIELPWDHMQNFWELMTIHHEVGHDIEADLHLRPELQAILRENLLQENVPPARVDVWCNWQGEIFADMVAMQLGGPAFTEVMLNLLLLPPSMVTAYNATDPHPTHYVRILLNTTFAHTLLPDHTGLSEYVDGVADKWIQLYARQIEFEPYLVDFHIVSRLLMDTPLSELNGMTPRQLMPYTAYEHGCINEAVRFLLTGHDKPERYSLQPRHCISAARLAVSQAQHQPGSLSDVIETINTRTSQLIRDNAKPGLRAFDESHDHAEFIASYVDEIAHGSQQIGLRLP